MFPYFTVLQARVSYGHLILLLLLSTFIKSVMIFFLLGHHDKLAQKWEKNTDFRDNGALDLEKIANGWVRRNKNGKYVNLNRRIILKQSSLIHKTMPYSTSEDMAWH